MTGDCTLDNWRITDWSWHIFSQSHNYRCFLMHFPFFHQHIATFLFFWEFNLWLVYHERALLKRFIILWFLIVDKDSVWAGFNKWEPSFVMFSNITWINGRIDMRVSLVIDQDLMVAHKKRTHLVFKSVASSKILQNKKG